MHLLVTTVGTSYLNTGTYKFKSSQKDERRYQLDVPWKLLQQANNFELLILWGLFLKRVWVA